jgi:hypothetical protein
MEETCPVRANKNSGEGDGILECNAVKAVHPITLNTASTHELDGCDG